MRRVYFLQRADGTGPIKIGCTAYPEDRRRQLSYNHKSEMRFLTMAPGRLADEKALHRRFAEHRTEGEWFTACPALLALIAEIAASGQLPDGVLDDRIDTIKRRYICGETLQQIGTDLHLTRERIRQILDEAGIPRRPAGGVARSHHVRQAA